MQRACRKTEFLCKGLLGKADHGGESVANLLQAGGGVCVCVRARMCVCASEKQTATVWQDFCLSGLLPKGLSWSACPPKQDTLKTWAMAKRIGCESID